MTSELSPTDPRLALLLDRADDTARIQSLAAMARALALSVRLDQMVELAAEEALKALGASSVSISCLKPGTGALHTMINVGELSPTEVRLPTDEVYQFDDYPQARALVSDLRVWITQADDPDGDPGEVALLRKLGAMGIHYFRPDSICRHRGGTAGIG